MERSVPLWLVLLLAMVGLVGAVLFAAVAVVTQGGSRTFGRIGDAALAVARFPSGARDTLRDLRYRVADQNADFLTVRQDAPVDLSLYRPLEVAEGITLRPPLYRADPARMERGWRILVGVFQLGDRHGNAALLLSPELKVVKLWELVPDGAEQIPTPVERRLVHEAEFVPDGSFIYNVTPSAGLIRRDSCSRILWAVPGEYHHSVMLDEAGRTVWTTTDREVTTIRQLEVASGKILREIPFMTIAEANPEIELWRIRATYAEPSLDMWNNRKMPIKWLTDPFHTNDIDPLPSRLAAAFPQFEAGDLLVSNRNINQVYVLDPRTLRVKWWRMGDWDHQHDPDWLPDGRIAVFDNRARLGGYSRIVVIDPRTGEVSVPVDGRKSGFYSLARGKAEPLPGGGFQVASAFQGRIFETDANGDVVFDVVNPRDGSPTLMYMTTQAYFLPEGQLDWSQWTCKPKL